MKSIEIIISPAGETKIEAKGFAGSSCQEATRSLERALGIRQSQQHKPEFHQSQAQANQQQVEG